MESERLIYKPFSAITDIENNIIGKSWANPFNARYNSMKNPYGSVQELSQISEPTFTNLNEYYDCMYYRVIFSKQTGELIGTCRFGKWYKCDNLDVWDAGANILLKYWSDGYGEEVLGAMVKIAQEHGAKYFVGVADIENFGSNKIMIKNSFDFVEIDEDGDYFCKLDLSKPKKSKEEIKENWQFYLTKVQECVGEEKLQRLQLVNSKIKELISRIKTGEDEDNLVKMYFEQLNAIEKFKFS